MLKGIYSRVRSGKGSAEAEPSEKCRSITEEEYQRFLFEDELYQQIVETEAALHNLEDPLEIAIGVMKAACGLYDADWSGILIVDLHSQLWRPEIWYDVHSGPMKETHFHELELTEEFVTWVQHLSEQTPLVIQDTESIRKDHPKEYEAYQRLGTRSVIGVPFGQHPLGFMVVRNPKRNIEKYQPLQVACFVAMMMLEHKRQLEAERRILLRETPDAPDDGKLWIRYNILGPHSLTVNGMTISEQDLQHPNRRAWILLLYLILHRTTVDQGTIAAENWPDESAKSAKNNIRQAIFRLHSDLAYYHDIKIIDTRAGMLKLSSDIHIVTDAEKMESLYKQALSIADQEKRLLLLKQAFELYRGRIFELGEADLGSWVIPFTAHYNQVFVDITKELLRVLGHKKDYHCLVEYAMQSLRREPGIQDAYYWGIVASDKVGNSVLKAKCLQMAEEMLTEEEYGKLMMLLNMMSDVPEKGG